MQVDVQKKALVQMSATEFPKNNNKKIYQEAKFANCSITTQARYEISVV